jgi:hypothetical protein
VTARVRARERTVGFALRMRLEIELIAKALGESGGGFEAR